MHLYAEDKKLTGRTIQIKGKEMYHFGTTGYLGLEQEDRIKEAAIQAIRDYGTQFPLSKSYISHPLYSELEAKIEEMYGIPPIITKNSTLGHLAIIPTLLRDEDGVIMDHQVHWSVQNACQLLKLRGIPVEMIRHNNLNMLEEKIKQLSQAVEQSPAPVAGRWMHHQPCGFVHHQQMCVLVDDINRHRFWPKRLTLQGGAHFQHHLVARFHAGRSL